MMIGIIIVGDCLIRMGDYKEFYGPNAVLPVSLIQKFDDYYGFESFGLWSNGPGATSEGIGQLLLLIYLVVGFLYAIGYKARIAGILLWVFTVSLQNRNPFVLSGADNLLRVVLFWLMFLPVSARWSIDALKNHSKTIRMPLLPCVFFSVQFLLMYLFTAYLKSGKEWHSEASAVYYALHYDLLVTPVGALFRSVDWLTQLFTITSIWIEWLAFFVWIFCFRFPKVRIATVIIFTIFHLGLALCLHLEHFPYVCIAAWFALLPKATWQKCSSIWKEEVTCLPKYLEIYLSFLFIGVICWNVRTTNYAVHKKWFPSYLNAWLVHARLEQSWSMFAPYPAKEDGYFVVLGVAEDNKRYDIFRKRNHDFTRKPDLSSTDFKNGRWEKFFSYLHGRGDALLHDATTEYLLRKHSGKNGFPHFKSVILRWIPEVTPPPRWVKPSK